jgi:hypothetical protein
MLNEPVTLMFENGTNDEVSHHLNFVKPATFA